MYSPRALLTSLHAAAVKGAAPYDRTREAVLSWLGDAAIDPSTPVRVIALGKASAAMAAGALSAFESAQLTVVGSVVVCASPPSESPPRTAAGLPVDLPGSLRVCIGDHPVPGPRSLEAADAISDFVLEIEPGDLVVVLLSGGTTALAAAPVAELSQMLGDTSLAQARLANLADTLLESGLAIHEMNAIRRRVLRWGAGRLALAIAARGAVRIPVFAISDVIGDEPAVIGSGPCTPDPFDESYFLALLDAHNVRGSLELEMARFLGLNGGSRAPSVPSPSHPAFRLVDYHLVARNADAVAALVAAAKQAGIEHVVVDEQPLEGEAAELGDRIARQALAAARALPPDVRALYVMGGEPVVNLRATYQQAWNDIEERDRARDADSLMSVDDLVADDIASSTDSAAMFDAADDDADDDDNRIEDDDEPMSGGRMQVLALSASLVLEDAVFSRERNAWRVHVLAAGTDGRDGPTDATGAIVDASVPSLGRKNGRMPERDLSTGRSWFALDRAEALLRTGPTGTNVMDIVAVLIDRA
jgi:hydroxypyruvate reductase